MKAQDYRNEIKNTQSNNRTLLLMYILRDMHSVGANCDRHKTIDAGIKAQIEFLEWKSAF